MLGFLIVDKLAFQRRIGGKEIYGTFKKNAQSNGHRGRENRPDYRGAR